MNNTSPKTKQKLLRLFTIVVFIYPILPLLLICFWAIAVLGISPLIELNTLSNIKLDAVVNWFILMIWLFGGIAGLVGLTQILTNKRTLTSLSLIIYGAISYTIVIIFFVLGSIQNMENYPLIIHAVYLIMSLCVLAAQIIITAKEVLKIRRLTSA